MERQRTRFLERAEVAALREALNEVGKLERSDAIEARKIEREQRSAARAVARALRMAPDNRICEMCGAMFVIATYSLQRTCSTECRHRAFRATKQREKDRRNARKRGSFVEDVWRSKVYARDNWICGLCGTPIDRSASVPSPNAATLDHIIPLAAGGAHSYANVQAAHFLCNSTKGDRPLEQGERLPPLFLVGERGPELFVPTTDGKIVDFSPQDWP